MANLIIPRVRVLWGDVNLTSYTGGGGAPEVFFTEGEKGAPIVYDISVTISAEGDGPTASMKWDPTSKGFAAYEYFVQNEEFMKKQISIEFFYPKGKKIVFMFVWAGQTINYGNDMTITVKMTSELGGLINANLRNTAQAHDEEKGVKFLDAMKKNQKQFGLDEFPDLLKFSKSAEEYANKATTVSVYGSDVTFGTSTANIARQMGASTFGNNIEKANVIIFAPYSYKGSKEEVIDASTVQGGTSPDPSKRYGYILGPAIIDTLTRTASWKPPQQDNNRTPASQPIVIDAKKNKDKIQKQVSNPQEKAGTTANKPTSSPLGTANNRGSSNVQALNNPEAPDRQNALNQEKAATLDMNTFMCPLLVGIKPNDIVFVPSLSGKYIEDWIVQDVSYTQSNGNVTVNLNATRIIGTGTPMQETIGENFKKIAKDKKLIGPDASLEGWEKYAWGLPSQAGTPSASDAAAKEAAEVKYYNDRYGEA